MGSAALIPVVNSLDTGRGVPPKEIKLFPLGLVKSKKGDFLVDMEAYNSILNHFKTHNVDIPIDYEHQTLQDVQAPAAGWIKDLTMKPDGVYATVEWTEKATEYLAAKEYRYLSPVVNVRESDRKALMLHSVALTNAPAIDGMTAIVNSTKTKHSTMMTPEGAEGNGSAPSSKSGGTDMDTVNLVEFIKGLCGMLQLPDNATFSDVEKRISELMQGQAALKLEVNSLRFEAHKIKAEESVTAALNDGKLLPYQKEWAFRSAMSDLEAFKNWAASAPHIVPMGEFPFESLALKDGEPCSHVHKLLGLSAEDVRRYGGKGDAT